MSNISEAAVALGAVRVSSLDWPELIARLAEEARSVPGRLACQMLVEPRHLAGDIKEARAAIAEVAEAAAVLEAGLTLPGLGFEDVEAQVEAAEKELVLGLEELKPIAALCEIAAEARRFFVGDGDQLTGDGAAEPESTGRGRPRAPLLAERASALEPWERLAHTIRATFDPAGEVRDSVSAELARLRRERESLSGRVRGEIERLMQEETFSSVLQDQFWTIRQDRYVLPLKASAKSMGLGIVHDSSRTGETVFVEPVAVVELNNRVKMCDLQIQHEIRRILEALSRDVAAAAPALRQNLAILAELDVITAKARLGVDYGGSPAALVDDTFVDLRQARHPLLMLRAARERFNVVPNDITLGGDPGRVLIVSGPNAGGKTVILKTIGLAALMARAGMLLPAAPGSRVGFFAQVLPDIGDRQSVMGDLSTFSAHLANLARILASAAAGTAAAPSAGRSLVLLDELMAGTNPEQGAALARATLEALADLGDRVLVVATTHADALKALPEDDPRFKNAGMEYDVDQLSPTFRVRTGVPGRSYALDIAARMGLPAGVLARAHELAGGGAVALENVIATLEAREATLARETERLVQAREELQATTEDQRAARAALDRRERELALHSRAAIEAAVREARDAIRVIVKQAQEAGSARAAEAARSALAEAAALALRDLPVQPPPVNPPVAALTVGARVRVPALGGAQGLVVKAPDDRGRLKVTVGNVTVDVHRSELADAGVAAAAAGGAATSAQTPAVRRGDIRRANARAAALSGGNGSAGGTPGGEAQDSLGWAVPSGANTLDLRGQRVDEIRDLVEGYLDRAALADRSPVFILHGHGTGALKKVVREYLAASPYVRRWAPGGKGQGGDGVTIVEL